MSPKTVFRSIRFRTTAGVQAFLDSKPHVQIFARRSYHSMTLSDPCATKDHHLCFGFASESRDYNKPEDTVPCDCVCHRGKRTINVNGQRFDYIVPEGDSDYDDPLSDKSVELEQFVRQIAEKQQTVASRMQKHSNEIKEYTVYTSRDLWEEYPTLRLPKVTRELTPAERLGALSEEEYVRLSLKTRKGFDNFNEQLVFSALGMAGEAGEVASLVSKIAFQGHPFTPAQRTHLLEEIGDTIWFMASLLDTIGFTFEDARVFNRAKLSVRYPNGEFSPEKSIARVDVALAQ